jgi:NAD(P)-dependent dehydrogenase (short-subunit alcohol dehydrogenase family)
MSRKVLITGATGDTGRASVREAIALGLEVRAMVRKIDERSEVLAAQGAEVVGGDLFDINSIGSALEGVEAAYFVYPVAPGLITAAVNFAQAVKETETRKKRGLTTAPTSDLELLWSSQTLPSKFTSSTSCSSRLTRPFGGVCTSAATAASPRYTRCSRSLSIGATFTSIVS